MECRHLLEPIQECTGVVGLGGGFQMVFVWLDCKRRGWTFWLAVSLLLFEQLLDLLCLGASVCAFPVSIFSNFYLI